MIKKITQLVLVALFSSLFSLNAYADFNDVKIAHPNYEAILYLQENNVIEGYSDGTFKPNNSVNRAEFLKIIIEGSNILTDVGTDTPFPDVDHNAWYGKYVKKAYAEGWIEGYPDGTFKPEQTINKVEAIKIVAEVQNWPLPDDTIQKAPFSDTPSDQWYIPYLNYAQEHNYLEETGSIFSPGDQMSRAKISEVIYRTLTIDNPDLELNQETVIEENEQEVEEEEMIEEEEETLNLNFTPVNVSNLGRNSFTNVSLSEEVPNTFYQDEVYYFEGQISSGNYDEIAVILTDKNSQNTTFKAEVNNGSFSVPVFFSESGNFKLGLLPGSVGEYIIQNISVLPQTPSPKNETISNKANNLNITHDENYTTLTFNKDNNTLTKATFTQGNKSQTYYNRQNKNTLAINYRDFADFDEGQVNYYLSIANLSGTNPLEISSGFTDSTSKNFQATLHENSEIEEDEISANPPNSLNSSSSDINFSVTLKADAALEAYVIKPNGLVDTLDLETNANTTTYFGAQYIPAGNQATFNYNPSTNGTYVVEINNKAGSAMINHPIYIGNYIPLLPNYSDLNPKKSFTGSINLNSVREEMLDLINDARTEHGFSTVTLSSELNELAQNHAEDMQANNYVAHVNLQGDGPDDRRIDAGISTPVGENIARNSSIGFAHFGLMRSASHRANILSSDWDRVGIGVVKDGDSLIIVQEFSSNPLTANELTSMESELLSEINSTRSNNQLGNLSRDTKLDTASTDITELVITNGESLNDENFSQILNDNEIFGANQVTIHGSNVWNSLKSTIIDVQNVSESDQWQKIGIDLSTDAQGILYAVILLNRP